ncbi:hypothetical protein BDN72DRAFT_573480 [Pluteus cervinus]|uniref:Uncharacterized protein n=1 Tax=Pluteus cervinus TaxID=181527 RepID=A0ACD3AXF7_9AGAR|nr:hypothetical protein BDN72DRAFT_573480 [Pluteus cervinus]
MSIDACLQPLRSDIYTTTALLGTSSPFATTSRSLSSSDEDDNGNCKSNENKRQELRLQCIIDALSNQDTCSRPPSATQSTTIASHEPRKPLHSHDRNENICSFDTRTQAREVNMLSRPSGCWKPVLVVNLCFPNPKILNISLAINYFPSKLSTSLLGSSSTRCRKPQSTKSGGGGGDKMVCSCPNRDEVLMLSEFG